MVRHDEIEIPSEIKMKCRDVVLHMDTIYINGLGFLTTINEPICYCTCTPLENGTSDEYYKVLDSVT